MTLNPLRLTALLAAFAATLGASPLALDTPVRTQADSAAPALATLKAGAEPVLAPGVTAPAGWTAVTLAGPHEVFAANKDINKALEVKVGGAYRTEPKAEAPVIATAEKGDVVEITGLRGKWTQLKLSKPLVGYIQVAAPAHATAAPAAAPATRSAPAIALPQAAAELSSLPASDAGAPAFVPGKVVPAGDGGSTALPRLFQGTMASTRNPLRPRRPYDFQLNDDGGARYAYVDVSKLLATEQIDKYIDRTVVVYGTARIVPGTKDVVILAESLQLR